jgi:hypothetical protein
MPEYVPALASERELSIRAHYVSGHFNLQEALDRIRMGGFTELATSLAEDILRKPISPTAVRSCTGRNVTEEQIADRLAEVTA